MQTPSRIFWAVGHPGYQRFAFDDHALDATEVETEAPALLTTIIVRMSLLFFAGSLLLGLDRFLIFSFPSLSLQP